MVQVTLVGRLTQEPAQNEANGYRFTRFGLACTTHRKDAQGQYITNFYNVNLIGNKGDVIAKNFHKGDGIIVIGNLLIREYVATDGTKRQSMDVDVTDFAFPPARAANNGDLAVKATPAPAAASGDDDDLPF